MAIVANELPRHSLALEQELVRGLLEIVRMATSQDDDKLVELVLRLNLLGILMQIMDQDIATLRLEAAWTLSNIVALSFAISAGCIVTTHYLYLDK